MRAARPLEATVCACAARVFSCQNSTCGSRVTRHAPAQLRARERSGRGKSRLRRKCRSRAAQHATTAGVHGRTGSGGCLVQRLSALTACITPCALAACRWCGRARELAAACALPHGRAAHVGQMWRPTAVTSQGAAREVTASLGAVARRVAHRAPRGKEAGQAQQARTARRGDGAAAELNAKQPPERCRPKQR